MEERRKHQRRLPDYQTISPWLVWCKLRRAHIAKMRHASSVPYACLRREVWILKPPLTTCFLIRQVLRALLLFHPLFSISLSHLLNRLDLSGLRPFRPQKWSLVPLLDRGDINLGESKEPSLKVSPFFPLLSKQSLNPRCVDQFHILPRNKYTPQKLPWTLDGH